MLLWILQAQQDRSLQRIDDTPSPNRGLEGVAVCMCMRMYVRYSTVLCLLSFRRLGQAQLCGDCQRDFRRRDHAESKGENSYLLYAL